MTNPPTYRYPSHADGQPSWKRRAVSLLGIPLVVGLLLSACSSTANHSSSASTSPSSNSGNGSNSNSVTTCVDNVKAAVANESAPVQWSLNAPAFSTSSLAGKKIFFDAASLEIPFIKATLNGLQTAAKAANVTVVPFDGSGSPATESQGILQAVSAHYDAIVLDSVLPDQNQTQLAAAKAASIPVVSFGSVNAGAPLEPNVQGEVAFSFSDAGKYMADEAILDSRCNVNGVIFNSSDIGTVTQSEIGGITGELKKYCPSTCNATITDTQVANWATALPGLTRTGIANQKVNWLFPLFDGMALYIDPAVVAAQAASRVHVATFNASSGIVQQLKQSNSPLYADVGSLSEWLGFAIADQTFRVMAGQAAIPNADVPLRTFDRANASSIDFNAPETEWYGASADFIKHYDTLWKVTG